MKKLITIALVNIIGFGSYVNADVNSTRSVLASYCSDNLRVLEGYDRVAQSWLEYAQQSEGLWDVELLFRAIEYAAEKHEGQLRKDDAKTPYIVHPIGVAELAWDIGKVRSVNLLASAILHDTLEDTDATDEEIETLFNSRVLYIVKEVTNDPNLTGVENKLRQVEHAPMMSLDGQTVKLADRLYNVRDLRNPPPSWTQEHIDKYYGWGAKLLTALCGTNQDLETALDSEITSHRSKP